MSTHALPASPCPNCARISDAATGATGDTRRPKEGDFSVCFGCGTLLRFRADLTLRLAEPAELLELPPEQQRTFAHFRSLIVARGRL